MATKSVTFDLYGRDKTASSALRGVGSSAGRMGDMFRKAGQVAAIGLIAAGAAAVTFGIQSVKAFADAQAQQEKLNFAYSKFPAITDVTRESYDQLNAALLVKTGFDDDAIASAQGVLAQFGLTGKQLQKLTPLLLDYARASEQDVVGAAADVGRAMLGQGRALKGIGIDFQDAGSVAANFDQVMAGLTTNVGGYAEQFGTTAAGKFQILTAKWGEFQEKVGSALLPGLEKLMEFADADIMPRLVAFADWFGTDGATGIADAFGWLVQYKDTLGPAATALGVLTAAQWLLNVAMDANPIGAVILGLGLLIGLAAAVQTNFLGVQNLIMSVTFNVQRAFTNMALGFAGFMEGLINVLIGGINGVLSLFGLDGLPSADLTSGIKSNWIQTSNNLLAGMAGGFDGAQAQANGSGVTGVGGLSRPGAPATAFAAGGIVKARPGGIFANIGEGRHNEAVVPLTPGNLAAMGNGGGATLVVNGFVGSEAQLAKVWERIQRNGRKVGAVA